MKLIFTQQGRQDEPAVIENADIDGIREFIHSADWKVYASIKLETDADNFMELYGTDGFGLEIMVAENRVQLVSASPVDSPQIQSILFFSYFRQDDHWRSQVEWEEKIESCCGISDDFSLTKFICRALFFRQVIKVQSAVFRCRYLFFVFKSKIYRLFGIRPPVFIGSDLTPEQDKFLGSALEEHNQNSKRLARFWGFDDYKEWGFDQKTGDFFLTLKNGKKVTASGQVYGSYSTAGSSWEWAWNNPNVADALKKDSRLAREYGKKQGKGFEYLCLGMPKVYHDMAPVYFAAITEKLSGAQGVFPAGYGAYTFYIGLKNLKKE